MCAANSNSGAWQQNARGHKVDLSLFFERFEQKKIIIWTIHLTIKHPPPPTPLFKAMFRVCNSHSR